MTRSSNIVIAYLIYTFSCSFSNHLIAQKGKSDHIQKNQIERWDIYELELIGPQSGNPFTEISISAEFKKGDLMFNPEGFYDGDGVYKIRFMPNEALYKFKFLKSH